MSEGPTKSTFLGQYHERMQAVCEHARSLAGGLTAEQLNWRPAEDKWSIAQCLEHTRIAADMYAEKMGPAIDAARKRFMHADGNVQPKHTVAGRLIMWAVDPDIKFTMKAPKDFRPNVETYTEDVVDAFLRSHEAVISMMNDSDGLALSKVKFGTPEVGIIRINLADGFALLTMHAERHLNQAYKVREASEFPA